jgi:diguanylate cyclase (GGDEF)-like protein
VVIVLVVLILGGAASAVAAVAVRRGQDRMAAQAMDHGIEDLSLMITDEVHDYRDTLADLATAIGAQETLKANEFAAMTAGLTSERLPAAAGISFVVPAYDPQVAGTQALWRSRGATGLTLYRTGTAVQHKYIVFARSINGLPPIIGRDLGSTPQSGKALDRAAALRGFTMSSAHYLGRDLKLPVDQRQVAVTLAAPVYAGRGAQLGWVTMSVRGGDFLTAAIREHSHGEAQLRLSDPAADAVATVAQVTEGTVLNDPHLNRESSLMFGRHVWQVNMRPTASLPGAAADRMAVLTLLAAAAFTLLLALLVAVLAGGRNRAMDRVDQATAALRRDIERRQEVEEELRRRESQLEELAFHDQLTGLANRKLFYDRVGHALHTHARAAHSFAVLFIDLDGFKLVNDELGHSAGDAVLREIADRLSACLRDGDTVARFGGDEFAVVVEHLADPADVRVTADRIVAAVQHPIEVSRRQVTVTASVGIALNRIGDTADTILREADLAMYVAKSGGKGRHVLAGT